MKDKKVSRRNFFKLVGSAGLLGTSVIATGCSGDPAGGKGWMPSQYNTAGSWPVKVKGRIAIDDKNLSIERDDAKCILCGQCIEVCKNVMSVYGSYELPIKNDTPCVNCGQCSLWCPSGAITEKNNIKQLLEALSDKSKHVIVQTAPATKVALGEEFGLAPGSVVEGKQVAALKEIGFDAVVDTCFSADLTIMEEAAEALHRLTSSNEPVPMFTSCCPGWVKFCEYYYPELIGNLSSCKSPQQMMGAVVKTYYAKQKGLNPENIFSVAIMPCTAKKYECKRPEMNSAGQEHGNAEIMDVDCVITTRELAQLIKSKKINLNNLADRDYDSILGESTGAGVIFGATGGVMEAAIRTLYYNVTKENPPAELLSWQSVRGLNGVKEASVSVPGVGEVKIAVCHGLKNARTVLKQVKNKEASWQFIEFMACPGGCIGGGGQPRTSLPPTDEIRKARIANLYSLDNKAVKRLSYQNKEIQDVYSKYFDKPLSDKSEELLHTHFENKSNLLNAKKDV